MLADRDGFILLEEFNVCNNLNKAQSKWIKSMNFPKENRCNAVFFCCVNAKRIILPTEMNCFIRKIWSQCSIVP